MAATTFARARLGLETYDRKERAASETRELVSIGGAIADALPILTATKKGAKDTRTQTGASWLVERLDKRATQVKCVADQLELTEADLDAATVLLLRRKLGEDLRPDVDGRSTAPFDVVS